MALQAGPNELVESIAICILDFFSNLDFQNEIIKYCTNLADSLMVLKVSSIMFVTKSVLMNLEYIILEELF